jgi:PAS domain S-box-containing protein
VSINRRLAEGAPAATRRLLEEIVRTLPLGLAVFDREMRYLAHSDGWLEFHGHTGDPDVIGRSHYEVFPQISETWRAVHGRCLAGATERSDLDRFETAAGGHEDLRWQVTPWHEDGGTIGGLLIYIERITEQVATTRRLGERDRLIEELFERSPIGLNLCRMDGLWLASNPAFLAMIGYSPAEVDGGLTYWELTPRRYDAEEAVQLERLRSERRYGPYEKEFIRKDGTRVPVRLNGFVVERDGEPHIWSLIEDMTGPVALEARLEEERLKAIQSHKLATVGEMAAGVAHEINNPLSIIEAYAYVLERAVATGDGAAVTEAIAAIRDATRRAGAIVRGLKKFARERDDAHRPAVPVAEVVEDALGLCRARIQTHGVGLTCTVDTDARIAGSAIELAQVLVNLLANAFDAVRESAERWIGLTAADGPAGWVTIAIEDSGPGLGAAGDADIFRAFFTTKPVGEGTGLGLSISRSIVERHGGTLTLDADAARTRFVNSLPRDPA